ncbi:hypothetical protein Q8A73_007523 [Channa argus]|nr:hypothetical protein Q8A73_007523 [Channa argus]
MIENSVENHAVYVAKQSGAIVWIGLHRVPWTWSDNSPSTVRKWQSGQPDSSGENKYCAAVNLQHEWASYDCDTKYPFICYQVSKRKTVVKITIKTDANITNPAINAQILQQLGSVLKIRIWTNLTLQWKIQPKIQQ